ncbi:hypothetical protein EBR11_03325 [bacterium]|nr:hypothetical protein [bacterium]
MSDLTQKPSPQRRGFSLVLSLTIMAMILLMVITLASFLSIESRLATANQLRTQARMQALVSLRLALAHLQQEAGPDRRATFRADATRYATASSAGTIPSWTNALNPMWTGVQRTDRPFQPPAWIISGRGDKAAGTQMVSLAKPPTTDTNGTSLTPYGVSINYSTDYWVPWDKNDATSGNYDGGAAASKIVLVGDATATAAENESGTDPLSGRPDGRVSLPPVTLPDTNVAGRYCYWVGDEGVKANIAINDPRLQNSSTLASARRGVARTGVELLSGFSNYQPGDIDSRVISTDQLKLLSSTVFSDSTGSNAKSLWPDVTLVSQGLFTDNKWGGLQIDLSTAFEKTDAAFLSSEFGSGTGSVESATADVTTQGNVTYAFDATYAISYAGALTATTSWRIPFRNWKKSISFNSATPTSLACVWSQNTNSAGGAPSSQAVRGPTWSALRDYHLLYQQLSGSPTSLSARTHFPNTVSLTAATGAYPSALGFNHYSQMYNRSITPLVWLNGATWTRNSLSDAFGLYTDFIGRDSIYIRPNRGNSFSTTIDNSAQSASAYSLPIPTRVSVAPYISRQQVVVGAIKNGGVVQIVISPITVFHNPYNVRLSVGQQRISIRDMNQWSIQYRRYYKSGVTPVDTWNTLGTVQDRWAQANYYLDLIKTNNPNATAAESLRFDIPAMTIEPGEFKVFTASSLSTNYAGTMTNAYNTNTGFYAPALANFKTAYTPNTAQPLTTTRADTNTLQIEMIPTWTSGGFKMVHQLVCWPGDTLPSGNASLLGYAFYNSCSVVSELTTSPILADINGNDPAPYVIVDATMKTVGESPDIIGVYDYGIRWPNDSGPFPIFARSNPMAASTRVDANDMTWDSSSTSAPPGPFRIGSEWYSNTSPSFKMEIRPQSGSTVNWSNLIQTSGTNAYGGMSNNPARSGVTSAVYTEVPLSPPLSIAQYAHANFGLRDHDPLFTIGNSFGPTFNVHGFYNTTNGSGNSATSTTTMYDPSGLINRALFDRYFLSGAAPVYSNGVLQKSLSAVLDDFVNGIGTLANPTTVLMSSFDATTTRTKLNNHRTVAAVTARQGAFNVHSMSKRAWAAVLAGAKARALSNETGDASLNARFPRAVRADTVDASGVNKAPYTTTAAWTGLTNLDDGQIRSLAKAIVDESTYRLSFYHREGWHSAVIGDFHGVLNGNAGSGKIRGLATAIPPYGTLPMPYLGLSQFVNRSNCPIPAGIIRYRAGALQTAILIADANGAKLANRNNTPDVTIPFVGASYITGVPSLVPPPAYISTANSITGNSTNWRQQVQLQFDTAPSATQEYGDVKIAAPTALLQSDILAAIGDSLTTRSDTFTIRAYGDVSDKAGGPIAGTCWIEAVVQRTPDFIDTKDPSERMVYNQLNGLGHNDQTSNPTSGLQPANINLGRRFVIVSMRILKPTEL